MTLVEVISMNPRNSSLSIHRLKYKPIHCLIHGMSEMQNA